jgi:hypothetical protein
MEQGQLAALIGAEETKTRTGKQMTNGDVLAIRDTEASLLGVQWNDDRQTVLNKASWCFEWTDAAVAVLSDKPRANADDIPFTPLGKHPVADPDVSEMTTVAFEKWRERGSVTPSQVKEALRRSLRQ